MQIVGFQDRAPFSLVDMYQCSGERCHLHLLVPSLETTRVAQQVMPLIFSQ
jgi:hypothetical protein